MSQRDELATHIQDTTYKGECMSNQPTPNYTLIITCSNLQIIGLILAFHDYRTLGAAVMALSGTILFTQSWRRYRRQ